MINEQTSAIQLQSDFLKMSESHLQMRASNNPEFALQFKKTFSDLIFSQNDEMLEKLSKTRQNSLLNAIFRATESGASFAKKEISFIPFEIFRKETKNGASVKVATGEYEALVIFDINFQKQQILKLANCKNFFTAEVHEGVEIVHDLTTGNLVFDGKNDVTKQTVGYYARFTTTDNEVYDLFMSCAEIITRAKFSPQFKSENYKETSKSIHFEKVVVRNLMKIIPKISNELQSVLAWGEHSELTEYELIENEKPNALEAAKKELSAKVEEPTVIEEKVPEIAPDAAETDKKSKEAVKTAIGPDEFF